MGTRSWQLAVLASYLAFPNCSLTGTVTFKPSDVLRVNHFYKSVPVRWLESAWLRWVGRLGLHKLVFAGLLVPHLCPTVTGLSA